MFPLTADGGSKNILQCFMTLSIGRLLFSDSHSATMATKGGQFLHRLRSFKFSLIEWLLLVAEFEILNFNDSACQNLNLTANNWLAESIRHAPFSVLKDG